MSVKLHFPNKQHSKILQILFIQIIKFLFVQTMFMIYPFNSCSFIVLASGKKLIDENIHFLPSFYIILPFLTCYVDMYL
jgi:hypothetical protein